MQTDECCTHLSFKIEVPSPTILGKIDLPLNMSTRPKKRTQKNFFLQNDKCCYCNRPFTESLLGTREHIIPKSKGGTNKLSNLKPCCFECNQLKSNLDLKQFETIVGNIIQILDGRSSLNIEHIKIIYKSLSKSRQGK